jgi:2,4-dienoyl-CoA reductase (NADPH2)
MVGGVGIVVTEDLSVDRSDWPYEYAPTLQSSLPTLSRLAELAQRYGSTVIASLNHSGGEGSSAYSQRALIAPSDEVDVDAMEPPKEMELHEVELLKEAFFDAATNAITAGVTGVEINVAQRSLLRQFLSSLTNHRTDSYGVDRTLLIQETLRGVRARLGNTALLGLRLCVDERASWGGIDLEFAGSLLNEVGDLLDYVVITSGSGFAKHLYRPDFHEPEAFNLSRARTLGERLPQRQWALVLQGSLRTIESAEFVLTSDTCDVVEMTRSLICDPDLPSRTQSLSPVRPCLGCNQGCLPSDTRNGTVTCLINPQSGWEHTRTSRDPQANLHELGFAARASRTRRSAPPTLHIVGAGVSGMELALNLHEAGIDSLKLYDSSPRAGGLLRALAHNPSAGLFDELLRYYLASLHHSGISVIERSIDDLSECEQIDDGDIIALCHGSQPAQPELLKGFARAHHWIDTATVYEDPERAREKIVVIIDEFGTTESIATTETLLNAGATVHLVTTDPVFATRAAPTGDLVPSLMRLRTHGCHLYCASQLTLVEPQPSGERLCGVISPTFGRQRQEIEFDLLVEVGTRTSRPAPSNRDALQVETYRIGDALAPRTISEALLEAQRFATTIRAISLSR